MIISLVVSTSLQKRLAINAVVESSKDSCDNRILLSNDVATCTKSYYGLFFLENMCQNQYVYTPDQGLCFQVLQIIFLLDIIFSQITGMLFWNNDNLTSNLHSDVTKSSRENTLDTVTFWLHLLIHNIDHLVVGYANKSLEMKRKMLLSTWNHK